MQMYKFSSASYTSCKLFCDAAPLVCFNLTAPLCQYYTETSAYITQRECHLEDSKLKRNEVCCVIVRYHLTLPGVHALVTPLDISKRNLQATLKTSCGWTSDVHHSAAILIEFISGTWRDMVLCPPELNNSPDVASCTPARVNPTGYYYTIISILVSY